MCCNIEYIGVFCTEDGTSVFGFSSMKNGQLSFKYYNTSDNLPFLGNVVTTCNV